MLLCVLEDKDMADNDRLYSILGVDKNADDKTIKKAYRKLAQKYHPDVSKEPDAEARFKEINKAHEVLSNPDRRALYDKYGEIALDPNFDENMYNAQMNGFGGFGGQGGFDFSDLFGQSGGYGGFGSQGGFSSGGFSFEDLFGQSGGFGRQSRSSQYPVKGEDRYASMDIDFMDAVHGKTATFTIDVREPDDSGRIVQRDATLEVKIPAGIKNGQKIRIPKKGEPGIYGGPAGDLYVEINVKDSPIFTREGNDIYTTVKVDAIAAILGTSVEVPTVYGPVDLKIPAGIQPGQKMRLGGKGIKSASGTGDEFVVIQVSLPKELTDAEKELLEKFQDLRQQK